MQLNIPLQKHRKKCSYWRHFRQIGRMKMATHCHIIFISRQWKDLVLVNWAHSFTLQSKTTKATKICRKWPINFLCTLQQWSQRLWSRRTYPTKLRRRYWRAIKDRRHLSNISREMFFGNRNLQLQKNLRVLANSGPESKRKWEQKFNLRTGHCLSLHETLFLSWIIFSSNIKKILVFRFLLNLFF